MDWVLIFVRGSLGIGGPILIILLGLWLVRGDRSPWYVKIGLLAALVLLLLILLGYL